MVAQRSTLTLENPMHHPHLSYVLWIAVFALLVRLALAVATTSWIFPTDNHSFKFGYEMGQIGAVLAAGNGFAWPDWHTSYPGQPTAWMPPIYPMVVAGSFTLFGVFTPTAAISLEVFQTLCSVFSCILLVYLGTRLYNARVGYGAAILFALYPPAVHYAVLTIWSTAFSMMCLLAIVLSFLRLAERPRYGHAVVFGLLLGFAALLDPVIMGVYPFAFIWLLVRAQTDWRHRLGLELTMFGIFLIVLSPWLVRNYLVFEDPVFIKSNLGNELFVGNNPLATATDRDGSLNQFLHKQGLLRPDNPLPADDRALLMSFNEVQRGRFLLAKAVTFIRNDPVSFLQRVAKRIFLYWTYIKPKRSLSSLISLGAYGVVLILAIIAVTLQRAHRPVVELLLVFILVMPLPYYITQINMHKYRFPIEPLLICLAAVTLYMLTRRFLPDTRMSQSWS